MYLPDGWYGTLAAGQAVWGAIPDKGQLRNGPPRTKGFVEIAYGELIVLRREYSKVLISQIDVIQPAALEEFVYKGIPARRASADQDGEDRHAISAHLAITEPIVNVSHHRESDWEVPDKAVSLLGGLHAMRR